MSYFMSKKDVEPIVKPGHTTYYLLTEANGCVAGFRSGITLFNSTEYPAPGKHEDQEGFVVMEGRGWARIGSEEYRLEPDVCFVAPAGVTHSIKRDPDVEYVKVCWFHGAIQ